MFFRLFCLALFGTLSAYAAEVPVVSEQNFDDTIKSGVVLVDFYGTWCGPCKKLGPVLDSASGKLKGNKKIVKVNIDQSKALADKYNVRAVPTMILFKNGKEVDRLQGAVNEETVLEFINSAN
ncbi:MAG: thioredoxin [Verrucomicrobia bacterium]|nr:thioredoxin [Verrucomicrobiota bacterium]